MKFYNFVFLFLLFASYSNVAWSEVNCWKDFNEGVSLIIKGNDAQAKFIQHDNRQLQFIESEDIELAKTEILLAINEVESAIGYYSKARDLFKGIIDFRCRRKIRKSWNKVNYINWRITNMIDAQKMLKLLHSNL